VRGIFKPSSPALLPGREKGVMLTQPFSLEGRGE